MFPIYFFAICLVFVSLSVLPLLVAIYPLDRVNGARDISPRRCPTGRRSNVAYAPGPDGRKDGATRFFGKVNSYIEIPNNGKLDTVASISVLMWVYHEGLKGPVVNYRPGPGWGVHIWMMGPRTFLARFVRRDGVFTKSVVVTSRKIRYRAWNYFSATYDYKTGVAKLWVNSRLLVVQRIGRFRLATNYPIRLGARRSGKRYFKGRIFCLQIYSRALDRKQIAAARSRCFRLCKCAIDNHNGDFNLRGFIPVKENNNNSAFSSLFSLCSADTNNNEEADITNHPEPNETKR